MWSAILNILQPGVPARFVWNRGIGYLALVLCTLIPVSGFSQSGLDYQSRGGNRFEGKIEEPVGAHFTLLSATLARLDWGRVSYPSELSVRFYAPKATRANVRLIEKQRVESYRLDSANKHWKRGWNQFGPWPTADVIARLEVEIDNLGVTVTESEEPSDSGQVFPAVLYEKNIPPLNGEYHFTVKSNTGLQPLSWTLYRVEGGKNIKINSQSMYLNKLSVDTPYDIRLSAASLSEGSYKLRIRGELIIQGQKEIVRKTYKFFHKHY